MASLMCATSPYWAPSRDESQRIAGSARLPKAPAGRREWPTPYDVVESVIVQPGQRAAPAAIDPYGTSSASARCGHTERYGSDDPAVVQAGSREQRANNTLRLARPDIIERYSWTHESCSFSEIAHQRRLDGIAVAKGCAGHGR